MTVLFYGDEMFDKMLEIGILFDFYGGLLSPRQYNFIELCYIHDLSLSEIGEEANVSRQSVHDTLNRAEENLLKYEKKLGLVKKFINNRKKINKILSLTKNIEETLMGKVNCDNKKVIYIYHIIKLQLTCSTNHYFI